MPKYLNPLIPQSVIFQFVFKSRYSDYLNAVFQNAKNLQIEKHAVY
jgi:hypothetical protein